VKTIYLENRMLHIETPLGVVNVRANLSDFKGRRVVSVEVLPDQFCGEKKVVRKGSANTRLVELKKIYRG
jgi:hypothetical protein